MTENHQIFHKILAYWHIQIRSQILYKIGQDNIKSGIGSKSDHFSKSKANQILVLQMHLNTAQCALKTSIDCDKLSNCLNSTNIFKRLGDIDEQIGPGPELVTGPCLGKITCLKLFSEKETKKSE